MFFDVLKRRMGALALRRSSLVCAALAALAPAPAALAAEPVVFATFRIPIHVESESRGLFVQVVREAADLAALAAVRIDVLPPPRAVRALAAGDSDALFPALDVNFPNGATVARSTEALDCKEDFVFTRKGSTPYATLEALKGKRVGITRGYPYAREVTDNPAFVIEEAASDEANIRKLMAGRIDAFVLDEKTGVRAFDALGLAREMQYEATLPVSRQEVYVAFRDTAQGREQARQFSVGLRKLKTSGRYKAITSGVTFAAGCAGR